MITGAELIAFTGVLLGLCPVIVCDFCYGGKILFFLYINEGNKIQYGGGEVLILVILFKMYFIWLVPWWLQRGRQGRKFGKLDLDLGGPLKFYWGVMRVLLTFGVVLRKETGRKKGYRK